MCFYFDRYEQRQPPPPVPTSIPRELLWQFLATVNLVLGGWYIGWRWLYSLNYDALWFAIPLLSAETAAYIGLILFTINMWKVKDYPQRPPPESINECLSEPFENDRSIKVDIYFPSYDEDPELVTLSLRDAQAVRCPDNVEVSIYLLDDGRRDSMVALCKEMGINYITRSSNEGFKAGNLRNAMEQTSGDFIVICDADTRPFPSLLENTLGYFRDPDVAWVQTPQWFFDIPEGRSLTDILETKISLPGRWLGQLMEKLFGSIVIGRDPFANDPQMFYDILQRRRNWANASFCCGAGSIHRREAVMEVALRGYADQINHALAQQTRAVQKKTKETHIDDELIDLMRRKELQETDFTPYKFHVSEDIYTSLVLHSDIERQWKSVMHPQVESKMLSPQDLQTWVVQRFKYAGGTLDITLRDNPLFKKGLSLPQRLMYGATVWSYLGGVWNLIFILAPIIYLLTGIAPVASFSIEFFAHIVPFIVMNELAMMVGTWGVSGSRGKASYLSFFPINLKALWTVLKGDEIKFPITPKTRQEGNFSHLVIPQMMVIALTVMAFGFAIAVYFNGNAMSYSINGLITNVLWCTNNIIAMFGMVMCAFWKPEVPLSA